MRKNIKNLGARHRLDVDKIIQTAKNLADEIKVRLPETNLAALAEEMAGLALATKERTRQASRPFLAVRVFSAFVISLVLLGLWYLAHHIHARWEFRTINDVFEGLNTGLRLLILLLGALWFCATVEIRIKRKQVLEFIEELRELAHVIDVTQLYYTPELYGYRHGARPGKPAFDEAYLLYCTQMLAVISNLAPLYSRAASGDSILRAVSEVEMLAIAISTKHLAKAEAVLGTNKNISGGAWNRRDNIARDPEEPPARLH